MYYGFTSDEAELITHFSRFLRDLNTNESVQHAEFDEALWKELVGGGWIEALSTGSGDMSRPAIVAMCEELGKVCPSVPWAPVLGFTAPLLSALSGARAEHLLQAIGGGAIITAVVPHGAPASVQVRQDSEQRTRLYGEAGLVAYAQDAQAVLIHATEGPVRGLMLVPTSGDGVCVSEVETVDLRHRYADIVLDGVEAEIIALPGPELEEALANALVQYSLLLSAEALGGLDRLIADTIKYVSARRQFGAQIGSFQAIKHLIAKTATTMENGRALTYSAASSAQHGEEDSTAQSAAARLYTAKHYLLGCEQLIQAHGGFGFTWEGGLHVWYRNSMVNGELIDRGHLARILTSCSTPSGAESELL